MNEKNKLGVKFQEDQEFAEKLLTMETPEEAQAFLKGEGLELSREELLEFREVILKITKLGESGELTEEDLEHISGGKIFDNPMMPRGYKDYPWYMYPSKAYTDAAFIGGGVMYYAVHPDKIRIPRGW